MTPTSYVQLDLFESVLHAYSGQHAEGRENQDMYKFVARHNGIPEESLEERVPVGSDGQPHNLLTRRLRWYQQTLKHLGVIERVPGERGVWRLTQQAGKDLHRIEPTVAVLGFSTDLGVAIVGSCESVFAGIEDQIDLVLTSPPYPLAKARAYGGPSESEFVDFITRTLEPLVRAMAPGASIVLNISNDIFMPGSPARSMYVERLALRLHDALGLELMDRMPWVNLSKPPGPVRWSSIERVHLNVGHEIVLWFSNDPSRVRSDNRRVLQTHTERHQRLMAQGGEARDSVFSDGAYRLHPGRFGQVTPGRIPRNVLQYGHACADQQLYKRRARALNLPAHGAPMPLKLASFLVEFLSRPGDVVADPYGGSHTTARAAQTLGRRWISTEVMLEYVLGGATRFWGEPGFEMHLAA